ncbi:precorrin-6Y C5,15-methyltransferase (decarboxylating) subunit CbiT [Clostridium rectalis]|uniref:precorrin-6Y C5,15-methyltransferase (decarboxylating) subunit CbiT n=1 Tax=Clostridium rectalis TaxID=2040295 RepID=UPI000F636CF6|nr:precorrin-6Y C5,15-methyltransferase (decarboxylating) subunit CbiT [Clostridium rectalis]
MTKEEIRILSTVKLNLKKNSRVLDIGAGTGSVSIQMAQICTEGEVIGIEKNLEALDVIYKNIDSFNITNLKVIEGEALQSFPKVLGEFDSIFIGGSGGNIEDIIKLYEQKLKIQGKMVLNFITINNLYKAMDTLKKLGFNVKCTEVTISKTRGETYMLMGYNPIFIIEGEKVNG